MKMHETSDPGAEDPLDPLAPLRQDGGEDWMDLVRRAERPRRGWIGAYEVLEEIRHGGQSLVFRAKQPGTSRVVALKRLASGALSSEEERRRFQREIEVLTRLPHPGIVTVHGVEFANDVPMLVMEWVDGRTLVEWAEGCSTGRSGLQRKLETFLQVCDAVQFAHQNGVIHRDLKPRNILVDGSDRCRVLDFGLARSLQGSPLSDPTRTEGFVGTPAYSAPERFQEGATPLDVRSDVYSLGIVLFEMLTGRLPFAAPGLTELLRDIQQRDVPDLSGMVPHVNRELDGIISRATAKSPAARYPTVHAFAEDLRAHLEGRPVQAMPPSRLYRTAKWIRRHRTVFTLSMLLLVSLITATIMGFRQAEIIGLERDEAESARWNAEHQAQLAAEEAHKAEAIHAFYLNALNEAAWPYRESSTDVFDVLEVAVARAREQLAAYPRIALTIEVEVATTLKARGRDEAALQLATRAMAFEQSLEPRQPLQRALLEGVVGDALQALKKPKEAIPHLLKAVQAGRRWREFVHPTNLAKWLCTLGHAYYQNGELELAEAHYREGSELLRDEPYGPWPKMVGGLAGVLDARGKQLEAIALLQEAKHRVATHPRGNDNLATLSFHLGILHGKRSEFEQAIPYMEEAVAALETFSGVAPELSYRRYWLASTYQVAERDDEANRIYESLTTDPRYAASARRGQGIIHERLGERELAIEKFEQALDQYEGRLVPADVSRADVQRRLFGLYVELERDDEARAMLADLLEETRRFSEYGSTLNAGEWREILRYAKQVERVQDVVDHLQRIHPALERRVPDNIEVQRIGLLVQALTMGG